MEFGGYSRTDRQPNTAQGALWPQATRAAVVRVWARLCARSRGEGRAMAGRPGRSAELPKEQDPAVHDMRRTSGRGSGAPTRRCAAQRARRGPPRKQGPHGRLPERGRERLEHREEEIWRSEVRPLPNGDVAKIRPRVLEPESGKRQKMILFCPQTPGCRSPQRAIAGAKSERPHPV